MSNTHFTPTNWEIQWLATWHRNDGGEAHRLAYVLIRKMYRNWIGGINNIVSANTFTPAQQKSFIFNLHFAHISKYFNRKNRDNFPYGLQKDQTEPTESQQRIECILTEGSLIDDIWGEMWCMLLTILTQNTHSRNNHIKNPARTHRQPENKARVKPTHRARWR